MGLRGGRWSYAGGNLTSVPRSTARRSCRDVAVSGRVHWTYTTGRVRAVVVVRSGGTVEHLRMRWSLQARAAVARIDGHASGRPLHAHMLAPTQQRGLTPLLRQA